MSAPVKVAVVGVGYLGRFHAEKFARLSQAELVGVVDANRDQAESVARSVGCQAFSDHRELLGKVEAVSVVTPTVYHHEVAKDFLAAGADVMCEKPMTTTLEQADELIELAGKEGRVLQVGHLERFNPAVEGMFARVGQPMFIEVNRIAPFKARATDVDVTLDLMIHDLDIILALVDEEPVEVRAKGVPVLGPHADLVNARLEFPGGCVANLTASRLALKDERKMRLFQPDAYLSLDFAKRRLLVVNGVEYRPGKIPKVKAERPRFPKSDPLEKELSAFLDSVRSRGVPRVDGWAGRRALSCAMSVRACVEQGLCQYQDILAASPKWVEALSSEEE
ncbi:MAG: Gfo/Idh/MocA family oxidoreductase [Desulfarculaceae bacterium]|nr:Gfo/Idh/MocA family oxidoreductase [Desulfarculaceae bacterium]MCF8072244.1 Gfo/Idh/MocA family oxidoreductase [Desulfarculaceae bacterium]MCF8100165.1 Gfo/Idh/MocA family oxidoreductase [Desulfarculaceae bacterium]MCF8117892.1 Gfo/Idh/MocA family oxidoreductase [Desulfarculaceae bacterium]